MTAGRFGEVDHDLLADYVGGALEGTPDEVTVARLVTEDPAWARVHDELAAALDRVGVTLAAWGESTPTMPAAVADRLTAALAGAGPATQAATVPTQPTPPAADSASSRTVAVVGDSAATGAPGRGRARRRWSRRAAPVLVATAAMVAAGFGVSQLVAPGGGQQHDASSAPREETVAEGGASGGFRLTTEPVRTGTSYTPENVGTASGPGVLSTAPGSPAPQPGTESEPRRPATAPGLDRLTARAALDACLDAVGAAHGRGPITVDRVEYAAFRGSPALVVGLVDAGGDRWVVVTGPECGVPGSGADTRYRAQVG